MSCAVTVDLAHVRAADHVTGLGRDHEVAGHAVEAAGHAARAVGHAVRAAVVVAASVEKEAVAPRTIAKKNLDRDLPLVRGVALEIEKMIKTMPMAATMTKYENWCLHYQLCNILQCIGLSSTILGCDYILV